MESNSLGSRGLRFKLHRVLAHAKSFLQTNLGNDYLRQHVGGGGGSHCDRRCKKPEGLSFAHEGQRLVCGVDCHLCILLQIPCRQWIRGGSWEAAVGAEKGEFVCSWKSSYDTLRFQCGRLFLSPKCQASMQESSSCAVQELLGDTLPKRTSLSKYTQPCPLVVADSCIIEHHAFIRFCLTRVLELAPLADIPPSTPSRTQCSTSN